MEPKMPPPRALAAFEVPVAEIGLLLAKILNGTVFLSDACCHHLEPWPLLECQMAPANCHQETGGMSFIFSVTGPCFVSRGLWPGMGFCLPKFQLMQDFSQTQMPSPRTLTTLGVPNVSSELTSHGNKPLRDWGSACQNSEQHRISPWPKLPPLRTLSAFQVPNASSKLTPGNWGMSFVCFRNGSLIVSRDLPLETFAVTSRLRVAENTMVNAAEKGNPECSEELDGAYVQQEEGEAQHWLLILAPILAI
ncbi:hypothetical protein IHE44_0012449 [Lamprotornis superbus]|uniref:Uncharacterized protein n=1 Tax=Lamprotornis superbus TaxID=245042 RepID=A0A835TPL8_9PASS|nr:hypothetical protein IHE44_0012449 [Lamprotornis superbus]